MAGSLLFKARCILCKHAFAAFWEGQLYCSATCCKAGASADPGALDEMKQVYAVLDEMHLRAWDNRLQGDYK